MVSAEYNVYSGNQVSDTGQSWPPCIECKISKIEYKISDILIQISYILY